MNHRYLGRMRSPAGEVLVLLGDGSDSVVARVGLILGNGYVIDRLAADAVHVHHANLDLRQIIPLPTPSETELVSHGR